MANFQQNQETNREIDNILNNIARPTKLELVPMSSIDSLRSDSYEQVIRSNELDIATRKLNSAMRRLELNVSKFELLADGHTNIFI
jgi:hypothetical protein